MTLMKRAAGWTLWGVVGTASLLAQPTDLSGTWKLNRTASQITQGVGLTALGTGGAPNTIYVTQAANGVLTIGSDVNESLARAYMVGGDSTIPAAQGGTVTVKTRWEGRTLVVEANNLKESLSMSADGGTLTIAVAITTATGSRVTTLVYTKALIEAPCKNWPTPCR